MRAFSLLEESKNINSPFLKDVFYALLSKPIQKLSDINECLSLDILNFVPLQDFLYFYKWKESDVKYLSDVFDIVGKNSSPLQN